MLYKFNTLVRILIVGFLIFPTPVYADNHITTETETLEIEESNTLQTADEVTL